MSEFKKVNGAIAEAVTGGFQRIEDGAVGGYKKSRAAWSVRSKRWRTTGI